MSFRAFILAAVAGLAPGLAAAAPVEIFYDDFAAEVAGAPGTVQTTNFSPLANWDIVDGTVDLFTHGGFGLPCGSTGCLDLDGSTGNAARLELKYETIFMAGVTYTLTLGLSGKNGGGLETLTFGTVGHAMTTYTSPAGAGSPVTLTTSFTYGATTADKLFLDHAGGDNYGLLLDFVRLEHDAPAVPLPAGLPLLLAGLGGLAMLRRR